MISTQFQLVKVGQTFTYEGQGYVKVSQTMACPTDTTAAFRPEQHVIVRGAMTPTQQGLWSLVVEIGGDRALFDLHPNLEGVFNRAVVILTEEGVIDATGRLAEEYR